MPRQPKKIWVIAREGHPVIQPTGVPIYHHHPVEIIDSPWARRQINDGDLIFCDPAQPVGAALAPPSEKAQPAQPVGAALAPPSEKAQPAQPVGAALAPPSEKAQQAAPLQRTLEIMAEIIHRNENLTKTGMPELPVLNTRLEAEGLDRLTAKERDELFERINKEE